MGAGIAQVAAQAGLAVTLVDVTPELASGAVGKLKKTLDRLVEKGKLSGEDRDATLARLRAAFEAPGRGGNDGNDATTTARLSEGLQALRVLPHQAAALEQGQHGFGGLGALGQAGTDGLGVEAGFLGAGVVEAKLLQGTTVPAAGAVAGHQAEARFPLLTEPLQAELDHRGLALLTGTELA